MRSFGKLGMSGSLAAALLLAGCSSSPPAPPPREASPSAPTTATRPAPPPSPPDAPQKTAIKTSPDLDEGALLNDRGDYAGAAQRFRRAIAADPRSVAAHYSLGVALQNARKWGEAGDAYEAAVKLDRTLALAHRHLGEVRLEQGERVAAQRAFEEATRLAPTDPGAWIGLALLQVRDRRPEVAARTLEQGARTAGTADLLYHLGLAREAANDLERARAAYEKAVELDPKHAPALTNLGVLVERGGDLDRALALWERAVAAAPDLVEGRKDLGAALHKRKGKSYLALEHLERALALGSKDARLPGWIAEAKDVSRTYRTDDRALAVFDRFEDGKVFVADGSYPVRDAAVADRARAAVRRGDRVRLVFETPVSPKVIGVEPLGK